MTCVTPRDSRRAWGSPTSCSAISNTYGLSLRLNLLCKCSFPQQLFHSSGVANILGSLFQLRFHLLSFVQWTLLASLHGIWPCHTLPVLSDLLEAFNRPPWHPHCDIFHALWTVLPTFCCQLKVQPGTSDHSCSNFCVYKKEMLHLESPASETFHGFCWMEPFVGEVLLSGHISYCSIFNL